MLAFETRPWGKWEEYINEPGYRVKRLIVDPGMRFSLQRHELRSEVWTVVSGSGLATIGTWTRRIAVGAVLEIQKREVHRLQNDTSDPLIIIEVQQGICDEEDIERIEDDWNRGSK